VLYKVWRSNKDKELHLLCAEGVDALEALPTAIIVDWRNRSGVTSAFTTSRQPAAEALPRSGKLWCPV